MKAERCIVNDISAVPADQLKHLPTTHFTFRVLTSNSAGSCMLRFCGRLPMKWPAHVTSPLPGFNCLLFLILAWKSHFVIHLRYSCTYFRCYSVYIAVLLFEQFTDNTFDLKKMLLQNPVKDYATCSVLHISFSDSCWLHGSHFWAFFTTRKYVLFWIYTAISWDCVLSVLF